MALHTEVAMAKEKPLKLVEESGPETALAKTDGEIVHSRSASNPDHTRLRKRTDAVHGAIFVGSAVSSAAAIGWLCNYLGWVWPPAVDAMLLLTGGATLWKLCGSVARHAMRVKAIPNVHVPSMWQLLADEPTIGFASDCLSAVLKATENKTVTGEANEIYLLLPQLLKEWRSAKVRLEKVGNRVASYTKDVPEALTATHKRMAAHKDQTEARITLILHFFDVAVVTTIEHQGQALGDSLEAKTKSVLEKLGEKDKEAKEGEQEVETLTNVVT